MRRPTNLRRYRRVLAPSLWERFCNLFRWID